MKQILVLVSKTSGGQVDVVPEIKNILKKYKVSFEIQRVKTPPEVSKIIQKELKNFQTFAVYGGDGSIIAAIKALANQKNKLVILPGGTANTIAGELSLPPSSAEMLEIYASGKYTTDYYDLAEAKGKPFVLDMHSGWWTEAIKNTPRELKKQFGAVAYGLTAIKKLPKAEKEFYKIQVGKKERNFKAYTVLIANQGQQGLLGVPLFRHKHRPGLVQVAFIKSLRPWRLALWIIGRAFNLNYDLGNAVKTYRGHKVSINQAPKNFLFDDAGKKMPFPFEIVGGRYETKIIVPPSEVQVSRLERVYVKSRLLIVRFFERVRNLFSGQPSFDYTRLAPHLFVGGTYRQKAYKQFKDWGVTGIVNMRSSVPEAAPEGFEILHLKTRDWTPPKIEDFEKGVAFIEKQIQSGGGAYVHCRQGEGRGPSMAAAYLISQGLSVEEALKHMQKYRPMARPNRKQVKRLSEWQEYLSNESKKE